MFFFNVPFHYLYFTAFRSFDDGISSISRPLSRLIRFSSFQHHRFELGVRLSKFRTASPVYNWPELAKTYNFLFYEKVFPNSVSELKFSDLGSTEDRVTIAESRGYKNQAMFHSDNKNVDRHLFSLSIHHLQQPRPRADSYFSASLKIRSPERSSGAKGDAGILCNPQTFRSLTCGISGGGFPRAGAQEILFARIEAADIGVKRAWVTEIGVTGGKLPLGQAP